MNEVDIIIPFNAAQLAPLYNLPAGSTQAQVAVEIRYWFDQTLENDGYPNLQSALVFAGELAILKITSKDGSAVPPETAKYMEVMPNFLKIGNDALTQVVPKIKADGKWNPHPNPGDPDWEFFLPHGLPMINFITVQFFHYPPYRLLKLRSYLDDPVPVRWGELLHAAGAVTEVVNKYQRFLDACPIAADDSQGAYMPVSYFKDYQEDMLKLFLEARPTTNNTTVPVLVFGIPAMAQFEHIFFANLDILVPQVAHIIPGLNTPCLGATHPYHFYAQAQIDVGENKTIGDGSMGRGCELAQVLMQQDLIAAYWQVQMGNNPSAGVGDTLFNATTWALGNNMKQTVCALTRHQGSLQYPPDYRETFKFSFNVDYPEPAMSFCTGVGINPCT